MSTYLIGYVAKYKQDLADIETESYQYSSTRF